MDTRSMDTRSMDKGVRYLPTATALGMFLALAYVACNVWDGVFPRWAMRETWGPLLPGFTWWSWGSFLVGLVETVLYGFLLALAVPFVRWVNRRSGAVRYAR